MGPSHAQGTGKNLPERVDLAISGGEATGEDLVEKLKGQHLEQRELDPHYSTLNRCLQGSAWCPGGTGLGSQKHSGARHRGRTPHLVRGRHMKQFFLSGGCHQRSAANVFLGVQEGGSHS